MPQQTVGGPQHEAQQVPSALLGQPNGRGVGDPYQNIPISVLVSHKTQPKQQMLPPFLQGKQRIADSPQQEERTPNQNDIATG